MKRLLAALAASAVLSTVASTQSFAREPSSTVQMNPDEAVVVAAFSQEWGVSSDDAESQLRAQDALDSIPLAALDPTFVDVWTVPGQSFEIVYASTAGVMRKETVEAFESAGLKDFVRHVQVPASMANLGRAQQSAKGALARRAVVADLGLDPVTGSVLVYSTSRPSNAAMRSIESSVAASSSPGQSVRVRWVDTPNVSAPTVGGGKSLSNGCTAGFVVKHVATNNLGLSTSAHCDNAQSYEGTGLVHMGESYGGTLDVQWHDQAITWHKTFWDGTWMRSVDGRKLRANMNLNDSVCKYGKATGYTCGYVADRNYCPSYVPNCASTFVVTNSGREDMSEPGDSGGPTFVGGIAWGLTSGHIPGTRKGIFMPQEYMEYIGIQVATQ